MNTELENGYAANMERSHGEETEITNGMGADTETVSNADKDSSPSSTAEAQRLAETIDALRTSVEQYRTLFASIDVGFCVIEVLFDAQGRPVDYRFLESNPAFERHSGLRDVAGRTIRELVPDLDDFWFRTYGNVAQTGEAVRFENYAPAMGRWFDVFALRIGLAGECRVGVLFTDNTERVEALTALQVKKNEVTSILESVTEAFFALDGEWRFTYVNAEAERVLSQKREELIGKNIWEEFPAAVGSEFEESYRRTARERVTTVFQGYYPPPLDSWYDVRSYPSPTGVGISVYFRNVNEERRREAERELLLAELQEASIRQRRFLREMLAGFTEGRLRLCFVRGELPAPLPPLSDAIPLSEPSLRLFRKQVEAVVERMHYPKKRLTDFLTACHEAAMNAVRHGGGGAARIRGDWDSSTIQVWIEDHGQGIAEEMIHRAVEQGWTTGGFGQGFFYMQSCVDRLYMLSVAGQGTTILLEMDRTPSQPSWLSSTTA